MQAGTVSGPRGRARAQGSVMCSSPTCMRRWLAWSSRTASKFLHASGVGAALKWATSSAVPPKSATASGLSCRPPVPSSQLSCLSSASHDNSLLPRYPLTLTSRTGAPGGKAQPYVRTEQAPPTTQEGPWGLTYTYNGESMRSHQRACLPLVQQHYSLRTA